MGTLSPFLAAFDGKRGQLDELHYLKASFVALDAVKLGVALGLGMAVVACVGFEGP